MGVPSAADVALMTRPAAGVSHDFGFIAPLTSLRFVAALWVLFYHAGATFAVHSPHIPSQISNILINGWMGVPFFFVLSGFILSCNYYGRSLTLKTSATFFMARFSRIYPVYLLALLLTVPFFKFSAGAADWFQFVLLQNWFGGSNWNFPAWTLSVELFFYICFPLIFPLLERRSAPLLGVTLTAIVAIIIAIWTQMRVDFDGTAIIPKLLKDVPLVILRLPEFIYGILFGIIFRSGWSLRSNVLLAVIGVIFAVSTMLTPGFYTQTVAVLSFGPIIFLVAGADRTGLVSRLLSLKYLVVLGSASYALYLLQYPYRLLLNEIAPVWIVRMLYVPSLIVLSVAVYLFYEEPMRRWLKGLASWRSPEPKTAS